MTQVARPIGDVSNVNWNPIPLFPHIGAPVPQDSSPIATPAVPGGVFTDQLSALASPGVGVHTLTVRFCKTDPLPGLVTFSLLQAGRTIAARSVEPTQPFTNYDLVLTEQEIDLISDYASLQVRVLVGGGGSGSGSPGSGSWGSLLGSVTGPGSIGSLTSGMGSASGSQAPGSGSPFGSLASGMGSTSGSQPSGSGLPGSTAPASGGSAGSVSGPTVSGGSGGEGSIGPRSGIIRSGVSGLSGSAGSQSGASGSGTSGSAASGGEPTDPCIDCIGGVAAAQYQFTMPVLTDGNCVGCGNYAGQTIILNYQFQCFYAAPSMPPCQNAGASLALSGSQIDLQIGAANYVLIIAAPYDCLSPMTLPLFNTDAQCLGWPASITVYPV